MNQEQLAKYAYNTLNMSLGSDGAYFYKRPNRVISLAKDKPLLTASSLALAAIAATAFNNYKKNKNVKIAGLPSLLPSVVSAARKGPSFLGRAMGYIKNNATPLAIGATAGAAVQGEKDSFTPENPPPINKQAGFSSNINNFIYRYVAE